MKNKISVIIPAYKEEKNIAATLTDLDNKGFGSSEIIVVDGSPDNLTQKEVEKFKQVIHKKLENSFRSGSMNTGAGISTGDVLLFLHADTTLPNSAFEELTQLDLEKQNYGCFHKKFSPNNLALQTISTINNIQTSIFGTMLGDNGIFVSKELFNKIGGFQNIKLMEDIEISKTLKKEGNMKVISDTIITSSRKFEKKGTIKTLLFMQYIRFLYFIGTDTKVLEQKYRNF